MRILLVTLVYAPAWRYGGLVAWAVEHARSLAEAGHAVTVLTSDLGCEAAGADGLRRQEEAGPVRVLRFPATLARGGRSAGMEAALAGEAAAHDVVHVSGFWQWGVALATRAARRAGKPCVLSPHGGLTAGVWQKRALAKRVFFLLRGRASLRDASAVHFVSSLERAAARGLPGGKAAFALAPSIDAAFWAPDDAERAATRRALGLDVGQRLLMWAGRVHPVKGLNLLPQALAGLKALPWRLLLIGGVEDEAETGARWGEIYAKLAAGGLI
jgi:glycosyltransferase involved in cell wall biosynthesis